MKGTMQIYLPKGIPDPPKVRSQQTRYQWRNSREILLKKEKGKDDGLDPFDRFTLKHDGVVTDNDGVNIARRRWA